MAINVESVCRSFGRVHALRDVSLKVSAGQIRALLGPNGAGKTTLMRILSGLVDPDEGTVEIAGIPCSALSSPRSRTLIGLVPSGDRSFYLRISGLENLLFFGRLHGLTRSAAFIRARECLEAVDLIEAADKPVGQYSHGMQKRLSVARAILTSPPILLVDEATHDLDPLSASRVRELVLDLVGQGTAVLWATQRVDEIRRFVDDVTVLDQGHVRFDGTVPQLMAMAVSENHLVRLRCTTAEGPELAAFAEVALGSLAAIEVADKSGGDHFFISLSEGKTLGEAISCLVTAGIQVMSCREGRSEIEAAFLLLTGGSDQ